MTTQNIAEQLEQIASQADFAARTATLKREWVSAGVGIEAVEPILRFIETHPDLDFGMPGALVHFVERFYGKGYDDRLIESVRRKPTSPTAWMLNRLINGAKSPEALQQLVAEMHQARVHPLADESARQEIDRFLQRISQ